MLAEQGEVYLHRFRWCLRPLPEEERNDLVSEVRRHLVAQAGAGPDALSRLLARLGPPDRLARGFVGDIAVTDAVNGSNPARLLRAVLAHGSRSAAALGLAALGSFLYAVGLASIAAALLKPFIPRLDGCWMRDGSIFCGIGADPAGVEIAGGWIIAGGLLVGVICLLLARRALRAAALIVLGRPTRAFVESSVGS